MRYAVVIHTDTTSKEAVADYMEMHRQRKQRERRQQHRWYFAKQRLSGIALLIITILTIILLDGDATIGVITAPLGLYMILGKEMLIMNDFWQGERGGK